MNKALPHAPGIMGNYDSWDRRIEQHETIYFF